MNTRILKRAEYIAIVAAAATFLFPVSTLAESFQASYSDFVVLPSVRPAQVITVTTLNDVTDFSGSQQVNDLPGPDGRVSFREACTAANNTPGAQTIAFAIPVAEFWLDLTMALLKLEQNAFFLNDPGTTVDFSTQTTNIGDTNPNGPEVGIYGLQPNGQGVAAIFVNGDNCVISGLGRVSQRGYGVQLVGDNNRVIGSQITGAYNAGVNIEGSGSIIPTGNTVGGTAPGEGNYLTGLTIRGPAENNIVIGNTIIGGVDVIGSTQYGVIVRNNRIGGPTPSERNVISGAGRFGEEGYPHGEQVSVVDADGTIIEGNYVGTTVDGMARYPQQIGTVGVEVRDSRGTTVRGNRIAGLRTVGVNHYNGQIFGWAVLVGATNASTYDTVIEGNTIGLAADGITPIVTRSGITVLPLRSSLHAFGTRIASNHIAGVETNGVVIGSQENGVTITGNSIHDSGLLGIDLLYNFNGVGGVTLNDPGDVDEGGNGLQNFPVLTSATTTGSAVTIQGTLDTSPSVGQFAVEFFSSPSCDPSGFGEGTLFLGSTPVTTDGAGHAAFSVTFPTAVPVGARATATATRLSTGDTSEFSACTAVTSQTVIARTAFDFDGDGKDDVSVYRDGIWYLLRSQLGFSAVNWGLATDKTVAGDYDGDGKTDTAVFRDGLWIILNSSNSAVSIVNWGLAGDIPIVGDYDGDNKTDLTVFRNGVWYILQSSNGGFVFASFGLATDKPVVGKFDTDNKSDIAVFRDGNWYILGSTAGFSAVGFGTIGDVAVPADYDGDGRTDVAVFRGGNWYILGTAAGFSAVGWGLATDTPVPADYDGDGKSDVAVFRNGNWYILQSSNGAFSAVAFGTTGDRPIPAQLQ